MASIRASVARRASHSARSAATSLGAPAHNSRMRNTLVSSGPERRIDRRRTSDNTRTHAPKRDGEQRHHRVRRHARKCSKTDKKPKRKQTFAFRFQLEQVGAVLQLASQRCLVNRRRGVQLDCGATSAKSSTTTTNDHDDDRNEPRPRPPRITTRTLTLADEPTMKHPSALVVGLGVVGLLHQIKLCDGGRATASDSGDARPARARARAHRCSARSAARRRAPLRAAAARAGARPSSWRSSGRFWRA